jgi:hypothetical protein
MSEWRPLIFGFGYIFILLVLMRLFPDSWWVRDLLTSFGVRPTGPNESYRRRDFFRASCVSSALAVLLLAGGVIVFMLAERLPNLSKAGNITFAFGFMCVILAGMSALGAVILAWKGVRWRAATGASHTDDSAD